LANRKLTPAGGKVELVDQASKGETVIQIKLADPCRARVARVLSTGEQAAVATAFFLAELAVTEGRSCVVLDDPVSSLDHDHREYFARRLVEEAKKRQVVIYTHDVTFVYYAHRRLGLGAFRATTCSFFLKSVLHSNDVLVAFRSTRIDLLTCTMRGIKTVTSRLTPFSLVGCPCRSNVKNRVYVQDIASLVLHEVWAEIAWDWNGVSVWDFACLGGKRVDAITGQWYLANAGAQYCPERPDSVHVRDRMDNQVFKYPANGFFCFMGTTTVTYRNVYVTGGVTGDVTTGQTVNIDEPVLCPPLSVHAATIRVSG
jgi:AAA domain